MAKQTLVAMDRPGHVSGSARDVCGAVGLGLFLRCQRLSFGPLLSVIASWQGEAARLVLEQLRSMVADWQGKHGRPVR